MRLRRLTLAWSRGFLDPPGQKDRQLHLVGLIAARDRLVRIRTCSARGLGTVDSWDSRFGRFRIRLGSFRLRFPGFMQLVVEFVLGLLKFLHRLTHSARKLG